MEEACRKLDNLVKDYLHFRGFISTYKTFEQELKNDKNKGFRVNVFCVLSFRNKMN